MNNTAASILRRLRANQRNVTRPGYSMEPTGCIAHKHRNGVITELTQFQFPMTFDDDAVAKCFGLETARLLLDASFRDFQIARYESEKRLIKQRRGGPSTVNFK